LTQLAFPQAPQFQWARQFGSPTGAIEDSAAAAAAGGGAYYVAGTTIGALPGNSSAGARDAFVRKYDAGGNILWTRQFGTSGNDWAFGAGVDSSGNVYVTGETGGSLAGQPHAGSSDIFIRKYDTNGNHIWTRQFGTNMPETAYTVAVDAAGNAAVAGLTQGALPGFTNQGGEDAVVRKFDSFGNTLWTWQFGTSGTDRAWAAAFDSTGELVVGGWTQGALPGHTWAGAYDAWMKKYSATGVEVWTRQFGTASNDWVLGLSIDPAGLIYAALNYPSGTLGKFDAAGNSVWTAPVGTPVNAVSADAAGVAIAGRAPATSPDSGNILVRYYNPSGAQQWSQTFGSGQFDEALGVALAGSAILVAGESYGVLPGESGSGGRDAVARLYDLSGNALWTGQFGGSGPGYTYAQAVHAGQSILTAGYTLGPLPGQPHSGAEDAYVAKHDAGGALIWLRQFGSGGRDFATAAASDPGGNVFVGGWTNDALPGFSRTSNYDAFLRKYDPSGNELWTRQFGVFAASEVRVSAAAADAAGNVYVAGSATHPLPAQTSAGGTDIFVRKYDAAGNVVWTRQFGTSSDEYGYSIVLDSSGGSLVSGYTGGTFPGQSKSGALDAFVARVDASGNLSWITQFGAGAGSVTFAFAVAAAPDGSIYAGGRTSAVLPGESSSGGQDAFLRKMNSSGGEIWTRQFGSPGTDEARGLAVDSAGNAAVVGYTTSVLPGQVSAGSQDVFVRKYDSSGTEMGTLQFGNSQADNVLAGAGDASGAVYAAGYTNGAYPGQTLEGYFSAFVLKFQTNAAPTVSVNQAAIAVPEGSTASNSGSFNDADAGDNVTLAASAGTVTKTGVNSGAWSWAMSAPDGPAAQTVTITANDGKGGVATVSFPVTVDNVTPTVSFSVTPSLSENQTATLNGTIADPGALDGHTVTIQWGDGAPSVLNLAPGVLAFTATHHYADDNPTGSASDAYNVSVSVTDKDGASSLAATAITVNNVAPAIGAASGPAGPLALGTAASVSAPVSDPGPQDTLTCTFSWDDGAPDTTANPSAGACAATHLYGAAGVYGVMVAVTDDDTGSAATRYEYVVVYDPSAGFVTGGGWIQSPAGAYLADPSLTGRANFGFVSKYQNGASTPSGQTEFQFQTARFRFTSTVYDWLVVAGARAQYKGSGAVNGEAGYGFLLTAVDGQVNGGGEVDKFRIKIWKKATESSPEVLVYDNVLGASDDIDAANPQALGGGSIVIHRN
jgi:hypothetical protein